MDACHSRNMTLCAVNPSSKNMRRMALHARQNVTEARRHGRPRPLMSCGPRKYCMYVVEQVVPLSATELH